VAIYYGRDISKMASWRRIGLMPPLRDADGEPFDALDLPCCIRPEWWDEDAPVGDKRAAAELCGHCPALRVCKIRRRELGTQASGVWGGVILKTDDHVCMGEVCACLTPATPTSG
jgi:hypothetical protein